jgi:uncharacterized protein (TIGR02246 family)
LRERSSRRAGFLARAGLTCSIARQKEFEMSEMVHENLREVIAEADKKFMALYKKGDAAGVAALYTDDPVLMPPGMDFIRGKEGIQKAFEAFMNMGVKEMVFDIVEVDHCGETAVEMSTFKLLGADGQQLDYGKFIVVWKHDRGEWKLHRDIFNSSKG